MRVITGTARGRNIKTLDTLDVRPTAQKVKEAIFSAIQFEIEGACVLDLFCGSGQIGIEALSRGAQFCVFVDNARASQDITKENLQNTDLFKSSRVVLMDYQSFLSSTKDTFDIAFLDPPYSKGMIELALPLLVPHMSDSGVIIIEHESSDILPPNAGDFSIGKQYNYGRISVTSYKKCIKNSRSGLI